MNKNVARALMADAFHQVLDNWVFRILTALALLPILLTFTVGVREEGIVLLYGLKTWTYEGLFSSMHIGLVPADPQGTLIQSILNLFFEFLAGALGLLLTIAATAFFVPRLLEKGSAELYFHKPVSRTTVFLSRYVAGLLFVGLASVVLSGGVYLGLALVSGYHDPAILVAALEITYVFGLIHAFSMLVGVVTRSTVAAILLTGFFFLFNGCIQQGWITLQTSRNGPELALERGRGAEEDEGTAPAPTEPEPPVEAVDEDEDDSPESSLATWFRRTLEVLHAALPKTTDADYLARKLRRAIGTPVFRDEDSLVFVPRLPEGLEAVEEGRRSGLPTGRVPADSLGEARFAARSDEPAALLALWRRPSVTSETRIGERVRTRVETTSQAAQALQKALEAQGVEPVERESCRLGAIPGGRDLSGQAVRWQEDGVHRMALLFRGNGTDWIYTLLVAPESDLEPEALQALADRLANHLGVDIGAVEDWYPSQLAFDAPWRFNILVSVGSSLAFAALMLLLGAWRLRRIAF